MKVGTKLKKEKISKTINTDLAIMDNIIKKQLERGREKSKNGPTYIDNRKMEVGIPHTQRQELPPIVF